MRDDIQRGMSIKRKETIKQYCNNLAEMGLIRGGSGRDLNDQIPENQPKIYNSNKIYYTRGGNGTKKRLIRVGIKELITYLEAKTNKEISPFVFPRNSVGKKGTNKKGLISPPDIENPEKSLILDKNRPFSIVPFDEKDPKKQEKPPANPDSITEINFNELDEAVKNDG